MTRSLAARVASALLLAAALAASSSARAEPPPPREALVPAPGRSLAGNDQASALATNPANLAFLPGAELRWTWVRTGADSTDAARGHAIDLAIPLPFHVATGLRLDLVRPPSASPAPFDAPWSWLTWGLAIRGGDAASIGFSVQHSYAASDALDGLTSFSAALSTRPSPYLGFSLVGRDLNEPRTRAGASIDRGVDLGLALRPLGKRSLELGLEERWRHETGQGLPRFTLGVDVPWVGRARGELALSDPWSDGRHVYTATAGLEIGLGASTYEGGAVFGTGVGGAGGAGFYAGASVGGYRNPGAPEPRRALSIRIEETPGARGHVRLLRKLWRLADDREIAAVALVLKAEPAASLAHAEELADAVALLRARGKKVVCHLEDAKARALYVCAGADRVAMHPAGGLRFAGLRAQYQYYGGLLAKLGVRAQFVRIGDHKTAPEQFARSGPTEVARADHEDLLHEADEVFVADVAKARGLAPDALRATIAKGPFVAEEARAGRLVDTLAFDDELGNVVDEVVGARVRLVDEPPPPRAPERFGARRGVALVYVEGDIVDGRSRDIPLVGSKLVGSYTLAKTFEQLRRDPLVAAVVVRVESPGGSSMASDVIWREIALTAKSRPVVVSMGSVAASGGYYVAAAGARIFASPLTTTGSIGIFYGKADVSELMAKIGVATETYKTAPRADAESIYRPFTDEEVVELRRKVGQFYDVFLDRVASGRRMTKDAVDAVGQGRVWTGRQALARGLVDELGGLRPALAEARRLADLPDDAPIDELPVPEASLLEVVAKLAGAEEPGAPIGAAFLPAPFAAIGRALVPFAILPADGPLARIDLVPVDEP